MDSAMILLIVALVLLIVSVVLFLWMLRKSHSGSKPVIETEPAAGRELAAQVSQAVAALRERTVGGVVDVRVPWLLLIGETGSGKTAIVDRLGSGTSGQPAPRGGVDWRFLDAGAIVHVPGAFLIGADGHGQKDGRWQRLMKELVRRRPERPLDGVVLTISAATLLHCDDKTIAERAAVAAAIRAKLDEMQKLTGLAAPVYLLITRCESVRGFGAFCWEIDPDHDDDMFGWSNPNTLETAYAEEWIDEAFDETARGIALQQLKIFGSRPVSAGSEDLFIFPLEFDSMRKALRAFATEIFRETVYVDSNFLRGVYFCGDSSVVATSSPRFDATGMQPKALPGLGAGSNGSLLSLAPVLSNGVPEATGQIVFLRHLFEFKIFAESKIARPVTGIRLSRNRKVLALQAASVIVLLLAASGMALANSRLSGTRDHLIALLQKIHQNQEEQNERSTMQGTGRWQAQVQTAYDLMFSLGSEEVGTFWSVTLPESWFDPLRTRVAAALTKEFDAVLLPNLKAGLDAKIQELLNGAPAQAPDCVIQKNAESPTADVVSWNQDPTYVGIDGYVNQYDALETAIADFNSVRHVGSGSLKQVDDLFSYLIGKRLPAGTASGSYFQQALSQSSDREQLVFDKMLAANKAQLLTIAFLNSWVRNNRLVGIKDEAGDSLAELEDRSLTSSDGLDTLAENIRTLDDEVTRNPPSWLADASFSVASYPALKRMAALDFATNDMVAAVTRCGQDAQDEARDDLLSDGAGGQDPLLSQHGTDIEVSAAVVALGNAIHWLLQQDFMNTQGAAARSMPPILWDTMALNRVKSLQDTYDKFVRERLPGLPPAARAGLQNAARWNLGQGLVNGVWHAASVPTGTGEDELLIEAKSFHDAVPALQQLQEDVPKSATGLNGLSNLLSMQAVDLAKRLNNVLDADPPYQYSTEALANWDGVKPLSQTIWNAETTELLDEYLATEREQMRTLATDYAQAIQAYLQQHNLERAGNFSRWTAIVRDLKDYDAKKPGNPIGMLETFIKTSEDKTVPAQGCITAGTNAGRASDYFLGIQSSVQAAVSQKCAELLLNAYNTNISGFFNQKLKGQFPFAPLSPGTSTVMADAGDAGVFFTRIAQQAQPFLAYDPKNPVNVMPRQFVAAAQAAGQMFAGGLSEGTPYVDMNVAFRANQAAEKDGDEIIEWELSSKDQQAQLPGAAMGVRWHYGDPMRITMRFAKDSPDIPLAGANEPGMRVSDRTVTWDFTTPWSLFELLSRHAAQASDFGAGSQASKNLLRFDIPIVADTSRVKGATPPANGANTARVYIRLNLKVTDGKNQRDVPVVDFPQEAPNAQPPAASNTQPGPSGAAPGKSILE